MTRAAPIGAEVGLYLDLQERVALGDIIETRSGRRYAVLAVRVQERGKNRGRQHLRVIVLASNEDPPTGARIHRIRWYSRNKGSARAGVKPRGRR